MEPYYIPSTLDEPWRIGPFTLDEFIGGAACIALGMVGQLTIGPIPFLAGLVCCAGWIIGLKMIKGRDGSFVFRNALYWHLPGLTKKRWFMPPSHIRNYWG